MDREMLVLAEFLELKGYEWMANHLKNVDITLMNPNLDEKKKFEIFEESHYIGIRHMKMKSKEKFRIYENHELMGRIFNG